MALIRKLRSLFIAAVLSATAAAVAAASPAQRVTVDPSATPLERFADAELERYAAKLLPADDTSTFVVGARGEINKNLDDDQTIRIQRDTVGGKPTTRVSGGSPRATLWAVYELVERWGVRFLSDRDVLPERPSPWTVPDEGIVLRPNLKVRQWRVMNAHACGPESWGIADYRRLIDQLAKLKFNRLLIYNWPWHPFVDFSAGGIKRSSATLWFGYRYPITPDMPGRSLFGERETEFWNPDLPPHATYDALHAAGETLMHALIAYAHERGLECVIVANLGEFPAEFAPMLKGSQPVQQIGDAKTIVPGVDTPPDDPKLNELATAVLRATVRTYPEADFVDVGMQEHRQWSARFAESWKSLDAKHGVEKVRPLDAILADAAKRTNYPGGAERAVREVKGDIVALDFYDRLIASGAATRADGTTPRFLFDGVAEELLPVLGKLVPRNAESLNFIDYTPRRILARRSSIVDAPGAPSTLIYTLHDDNVGLLPQLATHALHELTLELRRKKWSGFSTRYWLLGDHDACVAYLAKAAWDEHATPESVYADHAAAVYGSSKAVTKMQSVFTELEAATKLLEENGLGFAFPTPAMMTQHWKAGPLPVAFEQIEAHYRAAMDAAKAAEPVASQSGKPLVRYWIGRLDFGIEYLQAVKAARLGDADSALKHATRALQSYAGVARDRSDTGAIAVMGEFVYRPLKSLR